MRKSRNGRSRVWSSACCSGWVFGTLRFPISVLHVCLFLSAVSFSVPVLNSNSSSGFLLPCVLAVLLMAPNWFLRELKYFLVLGWSVFSYPVARLTSTPWHRGLVQEGETCSGSAERSCEINTISVQHVSGVVLQSLTAEANLSRSSLWWYTVPS